MRLEILNAIEDILRDNASSLGFETFVHYPTSQAREEDLPCLFLFEGTDEVIKSSSRGPITIPITRRLEIIFDILDIPKNAYNRALTVRDTLFINGQGVIPSLLTEKQMDGPYGSGVPGIVVCRLTLSTIYKTSLV
jgi:hypothetical protein